MSDEEKKRSMQIDPGRMKLSQYERQDWVVNAPQECTVDDLLEPAFWSLMAYQMKPYDRVEVRADDGTWLAELLVIGCDRNWAKVHLLAKHKLTGVDEAMAQSSAHRVEFKGPQKKWCIIRNSDNVFIREEIGSKDKAFAELKEFERTAASAA